MTIKTEGWDELKLSERIGIELKKLEEIIQKLNVDYWLQVKQCFYCSANLYCCRCVQKAEWQKEILQEIMRVKE